MQFNFAESKSLLKSRRRRKKKNPTRIFQKDALTSSVSLNKRALLLEMLAMRDRENCHCVLEALVDVRETAVKTLKRMMRRMTRERRSTGRNFSHVSACSCLRHQHSDNKEKNKNKTEQNKKR